MIENRQNVGFAAAVNQASRVAGGRYLLLLNPDTVVQMNAVDRLVTYLDGHPAVGICAPRVFSNDGRLRHNCFALETPWSMFWFAVGVGPLHPARGWLLRRNGWDIAADTPQVVEAVTGAAMLVRRDLFERLGGLDERFFMYCEDGDFCRRARQIDATTTLLPEAVVTHYGGASTPEAAVRLNGMIGEHLLCSRYSYTRKYWGYGAMIILRFAYGLAGLGFMAIGGLLPVRQGHTRIIEYGKLLWSTSFASPERNL